MYQNFFLLVDSRMIVFGSRNSNQNELGILYFQSPPANEKLHINNNELPIAN
jgi:hypothetical protein